MAKHGTGQEGDRELDEEKQKLTTVAVDVVAWPESSCGRRIWRRRAAVPAASRASIGRLWRLTACHLLQLDDALEEELGGQLGWARGRQWPRGARRRSGDLLGLLQIEQERRGQVHGKEGNGAGLLPDVSARGDRHRAVR